MPSQGRKPSFSLDPHSNEVQLLFGSAQDGRKARLGYPMSSDYQNGIAEAIVFRGPHRSEGGWEGWLHCTRTASLSVGEVAQKTAQIRRDQEIRGVGKTMEDTHPSVHPENQ